MSGNRQFVDTNILVYAHGVTAGDKHSRARVLVEVNVGGERSKTGIAPQALRALLERVRDPHMVVEGLMTVPPPDTDPRPYFA